MRCSFRLAQDHRGHVGLSQSQDFNAFLYGAIGQNDRFGTKGIADLA